MKLREKKYIALVLDRTNFFAEEGGQVGDTGKIIFEDGRVFRVVNTTRQGHCVLHWGEFLNDGIML